VLGGDCCIADSPWFDAAVGGIITTLMRCVLLCVDSRRGCVGELLIADNLSMPSPCSCCIDLRFAFPVAFDF